MTMKATNLMRGPAWALCAVLAMTAGCGDGGGGSVVGANGLTLETFTDTDIVGTYSDSVTTLQFAAHQTGDGVVVAEVGAGDTKLSVETDYNAGEVTTDGSNSAFNPEETEALQALEIELQAVLSGEEEAPRVEAALRSASTMASEATPGEAFPSVTGVSDRGWVTIGCSNMCRTLYRSCGGSYYKQTGVSSPNCKGRCGAGCGDARSNGYNAWTMDCAEHDYNIGPFGDCVDDYSFAGQAKCTYSPAEYCATNCACTTGPGC